MFRKISFALSIGVLLVGVSAPTFAVPIVVDFTGGGSMCTYSGFYGSYASCGQKLFTGTITYEIVGPTPIVGPSPSRAISTNGWVNSSFALQWDTGSYASASVPTLPLGNVEKQSAQVLDNNEGIFDGIVLSRTNSSYGEANSYENYFGVALWSRVLTWQNGLDFPTFLEMPPTDPIFGPITEFYFNNYSILNGNYSGYSGVGNIASLTMREPTINVSEPGAIALLGMGLVGFFLRRRSTRLERRMSHG